ASTTIEASGRFRRANSFDGGLPVVFVVPAHPEGAPAALVTALRHEVQIIVVRAEEVDAASVSRIGMEYVACIVPGEDADALTLGHPGRHPAEIVYGAPATDFILRERDAIVEIEIGRVRGHPIEAPAHPLAIGGELGIGRT